MREGEQQPRGGEQGICPSCGQSTSAHAADCSYEVVQKEYKQKLEATKQAEGITPEFEEAVRKGEVTFEKQMREVDETVRQTMGPESEREREITFDQQMDDLAEKLISKLDEQDSLFEVHKLMIEMRVNKIKEKVASFPAILADIDATIANYESKYRDSDWFEDTKFRSNKNIVKLLHESYDDLQATPSEVKVEEDLNSVLRSLVNKYGQISLLFEEMMDHKKMIEEKYS